MVLFVCFFPWLEVLLICPRLNSQVEWAVYLKDMIRVNVRLFPRHVSVFSGSELQKNISTSQIFPNVLAKRTGFAISKRF